MNKEYTPEQKVLFEQLERIAEGLGQTFAPFCEVVVTERTASPASCNLMIAAP